MSPTDITSSSEDYMIYIFDQYGFCCAQASINGCYFAFCVTNTTLYIVVSTALRFILYSFYVYINYLHTHNVDGHLYKFIDLVQKNVSRSKYVGIYLHAVYLYIHILCVKAAV